VDAEGVQALAKNTARLCQESVVLYSNCESLVLLSRHLRGRRRALSQDCATHHAASSLGKLHRMVRRRLRTGRLPYESAPIILGAPSDGGICGACDQPFTTRQLVMAVPVGDAFVQLDADCFMIWNEERGTTPAARSA
jgi:hypothetical protein